MSQIAPSEVASGSEGAPEPVAPELAAVVLAAGAGTRLRPLTRLRPKALCPVGDTPLVDLALARAGAVKASLAVNVHHGRALLEAHLAARPDVHVSIEEPVVLGTAGALAHLRPWIDGRGVLVLNADTWSTIELDPLVAGWDGERVRVLVHGTDRLVAGVGVVASLLPWSEVAALRPEPSGLYESCWRPALASGRLDAIAAEGPFVDCGTPGAYLRANLLAAAMSGTAGSIVGRGAVVAGTVDHSVIGHDAVVRGRVRHSVVWDGATVAPGEVLDSAIRAGRLTVRVRERRP